MATNDKILEKDRIIELKNVSKFYADKPVVKNLSISIRRGEFVTLLGPSGCGKTTTLRMIAGFENPTSGQVLMEGVDITNIPPYRRSVNTVFQRYALFPHLSVFENIAFGLKLKRLPTGTFKKDWRKREYEVMRKLTKQEIADKVHNALKMVDLEGYEGRNVSSLSGGQMQRVAIARALVNEPKVLLLDEPLGALDLKMRKDMQIELMDMHKRLGITFIYVTHDQEEALTMSDTIIVMRDGEVQQIANPQKIYDEPANAFVADFIGESNIVSGVMRRDYVIEMFGSEFACVDRGFKKDEPVDVIIRPEDIELVAVDSEKAMLVGHIQTSVFKGDHFQTTLLVRDADGDVNEVLVHHTNPRTVDSDVGVYIQPDCFHIMHKARLINELETEMVEEGVVDICEGHFECNSDLPAGTKVRVKIDFDDVEVLDDEEEGVIGATVVNSIYKGSYYQCIIRTDTYYDFFVDTEDDWLKGDRVGINLPKDKIIIEAIEEEVAK